MFESYLKIRNFNLQTIILNIMKSIFDSETKTDLINRIESLSAETNPNWSKMNVAQMLWHCQFPLKIAIKNENRSNGKWIMKFLKKSLYNNKPFKKSLPTAKGLITSESKNFNDEKNKLVDLISQTHNLKERSKWEPHPLFGNFTHNQWGQLEYKHLDHHLKQFGV